MEKGREGGKECGRERGKGGSEGGRKRKQNGISSNSHIVHTCTCMYVTHVQDYVSETHQTRQGNTTTPTEMAHFLFFSKKK